MVVDASLLLGQAEQDSNAARFLPIAQTRAAITAINFGEVLYKLAQVSRPDAQTEQLFVGLGQYPPAVEAAPVILDLDVDVPALAAGAVDGDKKTVWLKSKTRAGFCPARVESYRS